LLTSTGQVSIYYETGLSAQSADFFTLKGSEALGNEFLVPIQQMASQSIYSGFIITATEDSTLLTITPKMAITGHAANVPFNISMARGQTYFAQLTGLGVSGSEVLSNKSVAITSYTENFGAGDLGGDQVVPLTNVGRNYIAVKGYSALERIYVTATAANTQLTVDGVMVATLNRGDTYTYTFPAGNATHILATKDVTLLQLSGLEASYAVIPPIDGCTGVDEVRVLRSPGQAFFITVLVPSGGEGNFTFNGSTTLLQASDFTMVPGTTWMYARKNISTAQVASGDAAHIVNSSHKFHLGVIQGGPFSGEGFGYFSDFANVSTIASVAQNVSCQGGTVNFDLCVSSEAAISSYLWSGPAGFSSSLQNPVLTNVFAANAGTYRVIVTDVNGCTGEGTVNLILSLNCPALNCGRFPFITVRSTIQN